MDALKGFDFETFFAWLKGWVAKIIEMVKHTQEWLEKVEKTTAAN